MTRKDRGRLGMLRAELAQSARKLENEAAKDAPDPRKLGKATAQLENVKEAIRKEQQSQQSQQQD